LLELRHPWFRTGWLDRDELNELLDFLIHGNDYGVEELGFESIGDHLLVWFLDEDVSCSPEGMIEQIQQLIQSNGSD